MVDNENELRIKGTADFSDAQAKTQAFSDELALAEARAESVTAEHHKAVSDLAMAYDTAAAAVAKMGDMASVGGAKYKAAIEEAATAVADLEVKVDGMVGRGAGQYAGMAAEVKLFDNSVRAATVSVLEQSNAQKTLSAEANLARGNIGGIARALATMGGAAASAALPLLLIPAALQLLPSLFQKITEGGTALGNVINKLVYGWEEETIAEEKAQDALAKHDERLKKAADEHDLLYRAQLAVIAGLISETANVKLLGAEWLAYQEKIHGVTETSPELAKVLKEMGIKVKESLQDVRAEANTFLLVYQRILEVDGPAAAENFAKTNKTFLQKVIEDAHEAGTRVPAELQAIIDHLKLHTKAEDEAEKAIDKTKKTLESLTETLRKHAVTLKEHERTIEEHREKQEKTADEEFRIVKKGLEQQIMALNLAHQEGLVSEEEYRQRYAAIQVAEVDARREWQKAVDKINADAAKQTDRAIQHDTEETKTILEHKREQEDALTKLQLAKKRAEDEDSARMKKADENLDKHIEILQRHNEEVARANELYSALAEEKVPRVLQAFAAWDPVVGGLLLKISSLVGSLRQIDVGAGGTPGSEGA